MSTSLYVKSEDYKSFGYFLIFFIIWILFIRFMLDYIFEKGDTYEKKETYNLILTCLSSLSYDAKNDILNGQQPKLYSYFENDKKVADEIMTNEVATKYIFRLLKKKMKLLMQFIM